MFSLMFHVYDISPLKQQLCINIFLLLFFTVKHSVLIKLIIQHSVIMSTPILANIISTWNYPEASTDGWVWRSLLNYEFLFYLGGFQGLNSSNVCWQVRTFSCSLELPARFEIFRTKKIQIFCEDNDIPGKPTFALGMP